MWHKIKETNIPPEVFHELMFTRGKKYRAGTMLFRLYKEYKVQWKPKSCEAEFYKYERKSNIFLDNLWTRFAGENNTEVGVVYHEDWSFLDKASKTLINILGQRKAYARALQEESRGLLRFYRLCFESSTLKEEHLERILTLLVNRLLLGSLRYGKLAEKNYLKYDLALSIKTRVDLGFATETYEPFVDAFNILFLLYLKHPNKAEGIVSQGSNMLDNIEIALETGWPLGATDDGVHSQKV